MKTIELPIEPGEYVDFSDNQFGRLVNARVDRIEVYSYGLYAVIVHNGERYTVRYDKLQKREGAI